MSFEMSQSDLDFKIRQKLESLKKTYAEKGDTFSLGENEESRINFLTHTLDTFLCTDGGRQGLRDVPDGFKYQAADNIIEASLYMEFFLQHYPGARELLLEQGSPSVFLQALVSNEAVSCVESKPGGGTAFEKLLESCLQSFLDAGEGKILTDILTNEEFRDRLIGIVAKEAKQEEKQEEKQEKKELSATYKTDLEKLKSDIRQVPTATVTSVSAKEAVLVARQRAASSGFQARSGAIGADVFEDLGESAGTGSAESSAQKQRKKMQSDKRAKALAEVRGEGSAPVIPGSGRGADAGKGKEKVPKSGGIPEWWSATDAPKPR